MSHQPPVEYGWYCPQCNVLQPIYQRCALCETAFQLHCGRVGLCLRFNPVYSPLSPQGLCHTCRRLNLAGPSVGAPPPPPPPPPGGDAGGGPHGHQPAGGSPQQQQQRRQQQPHQNRRGGTSRGGRKDRSQGRRIDFQASDDEVFIGIGATGYGTPGDIYNGWWCIHRPGKNDKSETVIETKDESVLEASTKSSSAEKLLLSPTKKPKTSQSDNNDGDDKGERSDDDDGGCDRKHKVATPKE